MARLIAHDNCVCGNKKQICSKQCRICYVKDIKKPPINCRCGKQKSKKANMCRICCRLNKLKNTENTKSLKDLIHKNKRQCIYVRIRDHAKNKFNALDIKKECKICGYDFYVELAHIKPIHKFKLTTKIKKINDVKNLVYLCPNHHKELDKGKIKMHNNTAG